MQALILSMYVVTVFQGEDSSPSLGRLFHVGQLLPCYVLAVEGGTRVSLSVNPRLINTHLTHRDIKPRMVNTKYSLILFSTCMQVFILSEKQELTVVMHLWLCRPFTTHT